MVSNSKLCPEMPFTDVMMNWLSHQPLNCSFCRFPLYCLLLSLLVTPYVRIFRTVLVSDSLVSLTSTLTLLLHSIVFI